MQREVAADAMRRAASPSPGRQTLARLLSNNAALAGGLLLLLLLFVAVAAPWLAPADPDQINLRATLLPVGSPGNLLGTDDQGRDVLSRLIYGARVSLLVGLVVIGAATSIGVLLGAVSGYFGGLLDTLIMRFTDAMLAFPFLVLSIGAVAVLGPGLLNMILVLSAVSWIEVARVIRGAVLAERAREYVLAARVIGAGHWGVLWRHILPNCRGIIIVQATFGVAAALLAASALSYIGLGVQPPTAEWGAMLTAAKPYLRDHPSLTLLPGGALVITVMAINLVGGALQDALSPRRWRDGA